MFPHLPPPKGKTHYGQDEVGCIWLVWYVKNTLTSLACRVGFLLLVGYSFVL